MVERVRVCSIKHILLGYPTRVLLEDVLGSECLCEQEIEIVSIFLKRMFGADYLKRESEEKIRELKELWKYMILRNILAMI